MSEPNDAAIEWFHAIESNDDVLVSSMQSKEEKGDERGWRKEATPTNSGVSAAMRHCVLPDKSFEKI